jgi:hypothetical protein
MTESSSEVFAGVIREHFAKEVRRAELLGQIKDLEQRIIAAQTGKVWVQPWSSPDDTDPEIRFPHEEDAEPGCPFNRYETIDSQYEGELSPYIEAKQLEEYLWKKARPMVRHIVSSMREFPVCPMTNRQPTLRLRHHNKHIEAFFECEACQERVDDRV